MKNKVTNGIIKIKNKLQDGSLDSYYYYLFFYLFLPVILFLIWVIEIKYIILLLNYTFFKYNISRLLLTSISIFIIMTFNLWMFYIQLKLANYHRKRKDWLILLALIISVISSLSTLLFWLSAFLADLHNKLSVLLGVPNDIIQPFQNVGIITKYFTSISQFSISFLTIASITFMLNIFLPTSMQIKDVSTKLKFSRFSIKIGIVSFILVMSAIFSIVDKNNFASVSIFTTLFTFACTPQTILRVFSNHKSISSITVSDNVLRTFDIIKVIYYEFILSWSISIYVFNPDKAENKTIIAVIIFLSFFIVTVIVQQILIHKRKETFSSWIIDNKKIMRKYKHNRQYLPYKNKRR